MTESKRACGARLTGALTLTALVVACSSSSTAGQSSDEAATQYATAACDRIVACSPLLGKVSYGDTATCIATLKRAALASVTAPSTALTPAHAIACADKLRSIACNDLFDGKLPAACAPVPGGLAIGAACGDASQCQSGFCATPATTTCGTCAVPPAAGQPCVSGECPSALKCVAGTCRAPASAGAACGTDQPCGTSLTCVDGQCRNQGKIGDACDLQGKTAPVCDLLGAAAVCANGKTCEALTLAAAGDACGVVDKTLVACSARTYCAKTATDIKGVCSARSAEGSGCKEETDGGPTCVEGLTCVSGVCKFADPALCR